MRQQQLELDGLARVGFLATAENRQDNCLPVGLSLCTSSAPATQFTDDDNKWGNGSQFNRQTSAVESSPARA